MIPFEGLLPYGIIFTLLTVGGGTLQASRVYQNNGYRVRYAIDEYEHLMMERDYRLTGKFREQMAEEKAPEAFKYNGYWKVQTRSQWWW